MKGIQEILTNHGIIHRRMGNNDNEQRASFLIRMI